VTALAAFFRCYRINQRACGATTRSTVCSQLDVLDGTIHSPFDLVSPHAHSMFHALSSYPDRWRVSRVRHRPVDAAPARRADGHRRRPVALRHRRAAVRRARRLAGGADLRVVAGRSSRTPSNWYRSSPASSCCSPASVCWCRGWTASRRLLVVLSAVPLAACVYTYHATRIAPLVAFAYVAAAVWERRRAARAGAPRAGVGYGILALTLLVFVAALGPAIVGYVRDPGRSPRASTRLSIWIIMREQHSWQPLWEATWRTLGMFHYQQGPEYHWFGLGSTRPSTSSSARCVAHGLVVSLLGWRQARSVMLLVWVAVGLAPGILSGGAPRLYRSLLATPPLYVWAALPLAQMLAVARVRALPALRAAAIALVVAIPFIDSQYYFYRLYTHPVFHWFQGERMVEMARTLHRYGPGWNGT
jgi:hypothetical protein